MGRRTALIAALIIFPSAVLAVHAQGHPSATRARFGRAWFISAPDSEVRGFLTGYNDCLPSPAQRMLPGWYLPMGTMIERIARFYKVHKTTSLDVGTVALKIAATTPAPRRRSDGEVYKNRHGFLDGLWWKGAIGAEKPGYVEGYLVCLGRPTSVAVAQKVADAISAWYQRHPSKEDRAVAYVLEDILRMRK